MDKVKTLEDVRLRMVEEEKKILLEKLDYINKLTKDIRPRLTLPEFETYFMPFIIGLYERNEDNSIIYLHNYLHITDGNPNLEIVVVDENNEEKYNIPPVMVSDVILGNDNIEDIANAVSFFLKASENGPLAQAEANDLLTTTLSKLEEGLNIDKEQALKHIEDYVKIYNDYKHLLKDKDKYNNKTNEDKSITNTLNDEEVDDLFDY